MTNQQSSIAGIDTVILPMALRQPDGSKVRRVLPFLNRRTVGPFIQFYHFGPEEFDAGQGFDIRPPTHAGLAVLTYLVDGEIVLRDTLGRMQTILPGDVSWMTTGSGIVQQPSTEFKASGNNLLGFQAWMALPFQHEDVDADLAHFASPEIPRICADGVEFNLIAGASDGLISPVKVFSETIFAEIVLTGNARYQLKSEHRDRAVYVVAGEVRVVGQSGTFGEGALIVLTPSVEVVLQAPAFHAARLMLFGGGPLSDPRHV